MRRSVRFNSKFLISLLLPDTNSLPALKIQSPSLASFCKSAPSWKALKTFLLFIFSEVSFQYCHHQLYLTMVPSSTTATSTTHAHSFEVIISASNLTKLSEFYKFEATAFVSKFVSELFQWTVKLLLT